MAMAIVNQKRWRTGLAWGTVLRSWCCRGQPAPRACCFLGGPSRGRVHPGAGRVDAKAAALPTSVTLTEGKWKTADIKTETAQVM